MQVPTYFYVIVGGGMAGLQLARQLSRDIFFKGKKIAVIDPDFEIPSKTWCFWEEDAGKWDNLTTTSWKTGRFVTPQLNHKFNLDPYLYKMIKASDFYTDVLRELKRSEDIILIKDSISKIDPVTRSAEGKKTNYTATHFFDSRPNPAYLGEGKHNLIYQHFKGWEIETEKAAFEPSEFIMMDYRIPYQNATAFTYVLPISSNRALVEYTFFTPFLTEDSVYEKKLKEYLNRILKISDYKISTTEAGIIPMTDYPFEEENCPQITKIGTGGGWVKASSGYSFKNTEKKVAAIIENIKHGREINHKLIDKKFRKYDGIFLDVLQRNNKLGEKIFTKFYTKNEPTDIFRFLDEETSSSESLKIMFSLFNFEFIKSFFRKTF